MIAEQLQAARAAHWRQKQSPILTLDDAQGWLEQHPLCLYLPRQAQLPAPAPSFVEACMGSRQATPGAAAIEQAHGLLTRLIAAGTVVPLNLLGTLGEQPDFLAHSEALPFVLALRADTDWKHAPQKSSGHKVSPLVLELWKLLDKEGALTAAAARETLGRELTEAAVLRALSELWQALRIYPVLAEAGEVTRWEMLRVHHRGALETGNRTSQVTALSLLVSMYLQSVYAATSEEIEIFLSPVASRSRVREAVGGLSATRQIHSLSMAAQTYYFLENGLPEFTELAPPSALSEEQLTRATPPEQQSRPRTAPASSAPDSSAFSRSTPIFRRPKPEAGPKPAVIQPAAKGGWRSPTRSGAQGPPPWKPAVKAPAGGARWASKQEGTHSGGKQRPPSGSRRPYPPAHTPNRSYANPGGAPAGNRPAARPETRGGARSDRPPAWGKEERAKRSTAPWRSSSSPHGKGHGDSTRSTQKHRGQPGRDSVNRRGRAPANERAAAFQPRREREAGRERSVLPPGTPRRTQRPPSPDFENRSYRSNQAPGNQARSGAPPRGGRPSGPKPPKFDRRRFNARKFDAAKLGNRGRPFERASGQGGPRPASPSSAGRDAGPKAAPEANPRTSNNRPHSSGYGRPGGKGSGRGDKGRRDRAPRPPFASGSRPAKPWRRPPGSSAKPGKPPASPHGRKPDRKKPGA